MTTEHDRRVMALAAEVEKNLIALSNLTLTPSAKLDSAQKLALLEAHIMLEQGKAKLLEASRVPK